MPGWLCLVGQACLVVLGRACSVIGTHLSVFATFFLLPNCHLSFDFESIVLAACCFVFGPFVITACCVDFVPFVLAACICVLCVSCLAIGDSLASDNAGGKQ